MLDLPDYEKLGSFYLGKKFELAGNQLLDEKVLYDAKDLTTHAMCVGMTGSGKTGLCLALLEEAALDGIPAICIDPKGDLGNLLLTFPEFHASDFRPWLEESDAARQGLTLDAFSQQVASKWQAGIESWDQDADRIRRFRDAVDMAIYTPGSNAGIPLTVLKSFDAPAAAALEDFDVMRERVAGAASGLLTLMGIEADPISGREHILLSNIFDVAWRKGQNLDLPALIRSIQNPPFEKVGVFDLESFYPGRDRQKLAMALNNLLANPTFSGWLEGEPLDIKRLLHTPTGKPRLSIISIAHLSDAERMFFVTILLNELLAWMRSQPGTNSLRALFYMDEVFGYFPPSAKPPSKPPMMVLLKQARAFGLGIALATQNPVDLDYKGLSNIGTWFLGRLQTQRDKDRVLDGLEGAAAQTGMRFDRGAMEQTLAALGSRVFLMNNVHDDGPTIFQSRWAMSFLRGPLSRRQIQELMDPRRDEFNANQAQAGDVQDSNTGALPRTTTDSDPSTRPVVPHSVEERFWLAPTRPSSSYRTIYRPALLARVACHFVRKSADLDSWMDQTLLVAARDPLPEDIWAGAEVLSSEPELGSEPAEGFGFTELPSEMLSGSQYKRWDKALRDHLYRRLPLTLFTCKELKLTSLPGQDELDARLSWSQQVRELRDEKKEALQVKYARKLKTLEAKIRTAVQRLEREKAQYDQQKWSTMLNFGQTVLGAFLGNKVSSRGATAGRSLGRTAQQRTDVVLAQETIEALEYEKQSIEREFTSELKELQAEFKVESLTLEPFEVPCRKGDIQVRLLCLVWLPWEVDSSGIAKSLAEFPKP